MYCRSAADIPQPNAPVTRNLFQFLQIGQHCIEISIFQDAEADDPSGETVSGAGDHSSLLVAEFLDDRDAFHAFGHT